MEFLKYGIIALMVICSLAIFVFSVKSGKILKTLLLNSLAGIVGIMVINLTSKLSGVHIPLNYFTVGGALLYGLPSDVLFLILPIIFI